MYIIHIFKNVKKDTMIYYLKYSIDYILSYLTLIPKNNYTSKLINITAYTNEYTLINNRIFHVTSRMYCLTLHKLCTQYRAYFLVRTAMNRLRVHICSWRLVSKSKVSSRGMVQKLGRQICTERVAMHCNLESRGMSSVRYL